MKKIIILSIIVFLSCSQGKENQGMKNNVTDNAINSDVIKKLAARKIYFGHQSVGYNIIDGLTALLPADSGLNIIESSDPDSFSKPVFAHSQNGENFKPETKIAEFVKKMESGLGNKADIALFKFCYVDINSDTDVNKLFSEYKNSFDMLQKKYPNTLFLHITDPVTSEKVDGIKNKIKVSIKTLTGKKTGDVYDNIRRMEFNNLLIKEYGFKVFNLASIESSAAGKEMLNSKGGIEHYSLNPEFTDDGGHLNKNGSKLVAIKFIEFLAGNIK